MGNNKPAHEIKLGMIRATIWENETKDHDTWFNVTLVRLYKSDNEWKEIATFRRDDLPIAMKALDMAYSWVWRKQLRAQQSERKIASERLANTGR